MEIGREMCIPEALLHVKMLFEIFQKRLQMRIGWLIRLKFIHIDQFTKFLYRMNQKNHIFAFFSRKFFKIFFKNCM